MNIIAVDDEKLALEGLMSAIIKAAPDSQLHGFRKSDAIFEYIDSSPDGKVDVAFLDIEMRGDSGLKIARRLIERYPDINIIFTTGFSEYSLDAMEMHASGYIMKPVTAERVKKELQHLRHPKKEEAKAQLFVRTFGNFEVFLNQVPITFRYQKTKELLAYLIDRRGALCHNNEIISVLWGEEDEESSNSHISYLKNIRSDLISVLEKGNAGEALARSRGEMGIVMDKLDCDFFNYLDCADKAKKRSLFKGEYMSQYSWAEYTLGNLLKETGYI